MTCDPAVCVKCGMCVSGFTGDAKCPGEAITFDLGSGVAIDKERCVECGRCADLCALGAIT